MPPQHHQTFAALAEERRLISQRTGMHSLPRRRGASSLAIRSWRRRRPKRDTELRPILQKLAGQSLRAMAAEFDRRGIKSWSGKPWNAGLVRNAIVCLSFPGQ